MGVLLKPHQVDDVRWLLARGNGLLGHEVGGGKTFPSIVAARSMYPTGRILVVCPLSVMRQWRGAWAAAYPHDRVQSIHSPEQGQPYTSSARAAILGSPATWDVLLVNYDLLPRLKADLARIEWAGCIMDEAHRLKGYRGMRARSGSQSKSLFSFVDRIPYRVALTGTPILNGPEDAFGVFRGVDRGIFGDVLWRFEEEFFYDVSKDRNYKILRLRGDKRAEFEERVNANMRRFTKRQLMEMYPGQIVFPHDDVLLYDAYMPPAVLKVYDELEDTTRAELSDGTLIKRSHILGRMIALQMLAGGAFSHTVKEVKGVDDDGVPVLEEWRDVRILDMSHKTSIMDRIIEQTEPGSQVIVWAHFRHEIDALEAHLAKYGQGVSVRHGGNRGAAGDAAVAAFQAGRVRFLVAHPAAAGEGLDLQNAGHDIYFSRSYSLKDWEQAQGRISRLGSRFQSVTHHVIVCRNSVDDVINKALCEKRALASTITRDDLMAALK